MKKTNKKLIALFMVFCLIIGSSFVTVNGASIKLNKTKMNLYIGESRKLKISGTKKKIKWSSSNKKIATVSKKGLVKGKKKGTVTITAKIGKKKLNCKVKVFNVLATSTQALTIKNFNKRNSLYVKFTGLGTVSYKVKNENIAYCKWKKGWDGDQATLFVYGKTKGSTYITISNTFNNEKIKVKVNVIAKTEKEIKESQLNLDIKIETPRKFEEYFMKYITINGIKVPDKYTKRYEFSLNGISKKIVYDVKQKKYNVNLVFNGELTYSYSDWSSTGVQLRIKYNVVKDGYVVKTGTMLTNPLKEGYKFEEESTFYLDNPGNYTIELLSYSIID